MKSPRLISLIAMAGFFLGPCGQAQPFLAAGAQAELLLRGSQGAEALTTHNLHVDDEEEHVITKTFAPEQWVVALDKKIARQEGVVRAVQIEVATQKSRLDRLSQVAPTGPGALQRIAENAAGNILGNILGTILITLLPALWLVFIKKKPRSFAS